MDGQKILLDSAAKGQTGQTGQTPASDYASGVVSGMSGSDALNMLAPKTEGPSAPASNPSPQTQMSASEPVSPGTTPNPVTNPAPSSIADLASIYGNKTDLPAGVNDYTPAIQGLYGALLEAQLQQFQNAYDQNVATLQQNQQGINQAYVDQSNNLASQFEQTRRANNMKADLNGLNTGASSQMDLAQQSNYMSGQGQIAQSQANANAAAQNALANLETQYKNDISSAISSNNYQLAVALLNEWKDRDNAANSAQATQAATLAAYGDFSGYASLYGQDVADAMHQYWLLSNPSIAYTMGQITADQYFNLTGQYPPDSQPAASYGGYSGNGGNGGQNAYNSFTSGIEDRFNNGESLQTVLGDVAAFGQEYNLSNNQIADLQDYVLSTYTGYMDHWNALLDAEG